MVKIEKIKMPKKILLIYPKVGSRGWHLPAGLLMIAAPLLEAGFEVKIIDQRFGADWENKLVGELEKEPLLVGMTVMTGKQILEALEISKIVKEKSEAKVVWGGVHPSLLPEQTLNNQQIDFAVLGEGEKTILELALKLELNENDFENIKGLGFKKGGRIHCSWRDDFVDLDKMPILPYHLVEIEKYISKKSKTTGKPAREIVLFTSRGCPHRCGFCYNLKFNRRKWRAMNAERVIKEIKFLIDHYQIDGFNIQDDEFFVDAGRVAQICELVKENNLKIEFHSAARVNQTADLMDMDLLKKLKNCGFGSIVFGVETGSQRILELVNKDIAYEQVIKTINKLGEANIGSKYCFMAGFPTETIKDFYQTIDLIYKMKELDPEVRIPVLRAFTPYPGIPLWDLCVREGFEPPKTLEGWAEYDFEAIKMPWVGKRLTKMIENVNIMIDYLKLEPGFSANFKYKLSLIFSRWISFRWRNHLFLFLPEKYLIRWLK